MRWLFDDWRLGFVLSLFIAKVLESLVKRNYAPKILTLGKFRSKLVFWSAALD